jgi:hypothetical protein
VDEFTALRLGGGVIVLLDLHLPGSHLAASGHRVLVVSASEQSADVVQAIGAGARGYLSKQAEETEILGAIQAVAQKRPYVSATLAGYLLQAPIQITAREREILELVAGGETDQDIAEQLTSACGRSIPTWTASGIRPARAAAPTLPASPLSAASSPAAPKRGNSLPLSLGIPALPSLGLRQR